jgi:hypothetical protein
MKLWTLKRIYNLPENDDPWITPYDKLRSIVVRAESEQIARSLAAENSFDEIDWEPCNPWLSPKYTSCKELLTSGKQEVIVVDFQTNLR